MQRKRIVIAIIFIIMGLLFSNVLYAQDQKSPITIKFMNSCKCTNMEITKTDNIISIVYIRIDGERESVTLKPEMNYHIQWMPE